jgi:hypothetical protein
MIVAPIAAFAVVASVLWELPHGDRITREKYERIQADTTIGLAGVEAILGPADDYRTGPTHPESTVYNFFSGPQSGFVVKTWYGDTATIELHFFGDRIVGMFYTPTRRVHQSPLQNVVWRAERLWRKWFPE